MSDHLEHIPKQRAGALRAKMLEPTHPHKLIVIQLSGGNDGLNTIIPFRNDIYYQNRPVLGIRKKGNYRLNDEALFNGMLKGFKKLYDDGLLTIINNVGYPNPTRSHFSAMDIWHTASLKVDKYSTGWLGRFLELPQNKGRSIPVIELSDTLNLAMKGKHRNGVAVNNHIEFFKTLDSTLLQRTISTGVPSIDNKDLSLIYQTLHESYFSFKPIVENSLSTQLTDTFDNSEFGRDCYSICNMIVSGAPTQVYYASHGSFDTHANQEGTHKQLLKSLGDNVHKIVKTLRKYDAFSNVSILIFSEFGRRVKENGSKGTDHGTANNLYLISEHLQTAGMLNEMPDLTNLEDGDIPFSVDFRTIYAAILDQWLGVDHKYILDINLPVPNLFNVRSTIA